MRPCQQCGTAILVKQIECPLCGCQQSAMAGMAADSIDDIEVVERQEEIQLETDFVIERVLVSTVSAVLCLLLVIGFLSGGIGGAIYAGVVFAFAVLLGFGVGMDFSG